MNQSPPYILIAEDEELNQEVYLEQLSSDYKVKIAKDGKECLTLLKEKTPDILLLDINMPGLHGYNVCNYVRRDPKYKSLAIVFVSALSTDKEQQAGFNAGANDFLAKPYKKEQLLSMIKKWL